MDKTTPQISQPQGLTVHESSLIEMLAGAVRRPFSVWLSKADPGASEAPVSEWIDQGTPQESIQAEHPAPTAILDLAMGSPRSVSQIDLEGRVWVARRLASRSEAVVAVMTDTSEADLVEGLIDSVFAHHRASTDWVELEEENNTFAMQLSSDLEELSFLRSMVERLSSSRIDDTLCGMAQSTLPVLNATVRAQCLAFLSLPNPSDPYSADVAAVDGSQTIGHAMLGEVVRRFGPTVKGQPLVKNWEADSLPSESSLGFEHDRLPGISSLILAPMVSGKKHLGWLLAINRAVSGEIGLESSWQLASGEFGSGEGSLIATTASILATHAANIDLLREKEQLMVNMIRTLVSAIESKDNYTRGHSERVALYTRRLAEQIGYDEADVEKVYLTSLLHDVGKIGVSDAVLKKDGKLTAEEYAEIARHPDEGWAILCDLEQLRYVLPGVLHHHERWDGRGYPDGLSGQSIPLDGRVMAVADAYDAMTSDRPYRSGMPTEKAESILREGAGTQWDPQCIKAFFACVDDIHQIKNSYEQRERPTRVPTEVRDESLPLPHELAGMPE